MAEQFDFKSLGLEAQAHTLGSAYALAFTSILAERSLTDFKALSIPEVMELGEVWNVRLDDLCDANVSISEAGSQMEEVLGTPSYILWTLSFLRQMDVFTEEQLQAISKDMDEDAALN